MELKFSIYEGVSEHLKGRLGVVCQCVRNAPSCTIEDAAKSRGFLNFINYEGLPTDYREERQFQKLFKMVCSRFFCGELDCLKFSHFMHYLQNCFSPKIQSQFIWIGSPPENFCYHLCKNMLFKTICLSQRGAISVKL